MRSACEACAEPIEVGRKITVLDGHPFHHSCYCAMRGGKVFVRPYKSTAPDLAIVHTIHLFIFGHL